MRYSHVLVFLLSISFRYHSGVATLHPTLPLKNPKTLHFWQNFLCYSPWCLDHCHFNRSDDATGRRDRASFNVSNQNPPITNTYNICFANGQATQTNPTQRGFTSKRSLETYHQLMVCLITDAPHQTIFCTGTY